METPNWLRIIGVSAGTTEIHRHCDTPRDRATGECTTVGEFPVFQVNEKAVLVLSGVSVTGGQSGTGGGILNQGSLLVYDSTISQNHGHFAGGGIYQGGPGNPWLYLQDSTVNDNSVHFIGGGGIFIDSGTTQITHSTIHSNWTVPSSRGGTAIGGGIANGQIIYETDMNGSRVIGPDGEPVEKERTGGVLSIVNSTIIGNIDHSPQKLGAAGGITRIGGEVWLKNVTITDNEVKSPPNAYAYGNGIFGLGGFYFANTIIARNDLAPECGGLVFTLGGNLVGTSYGCHIEATAWDDSWPPPAKDRIGNPSACDHNPDVNCLDQKYLNPLFEVGSDLRPLLKDNGGTSCTVALQQGSMAINNAWTGKPGQHPFACDAYDQRWIQRDSATTGANCDIGAFEFKSGKITPSGLGCSRQAH